MKIKPCLPPWCKPNCKVIETWDEPVVSGDAHGTVTFVKYLNAKKKERVMEKLVKWGRQVGEK